MKNKALIIIIGIVTILLVVLLGLRYNFSDNAKKLKSDISYPTSDSLAFSCESTTIAVGEETICSLVGKHTGGINAINGQIKVDEELERVKVSYDDEVWNKLDNFPVVSLLEINSNSTTEQFIVVQVKVKGLTAGSPKITFTAMDGQTSATIVEKTGETTRNTITLTDVTQTITVTDSSSSGEDEGGDEPELSAINTLESLTVSPGSLSPVFGRTTYDYEVIVPNNATQIVVNGTATDSAKADVEGFDTYSLSDLNVGDEKDITITVIAENGERQEYTITVRRQAPEDPTKSSDNTLKNLSITGATITPAFSSSVTSYNVTVENSVTKVELNAEANDANATIDVDAPETLVEGNNTITITVTAENQQIKNYTIVVNRKAKEADTCTLSLTSTAYKIDNIKQVIDAVNKDDTDETIRKNITASCGSFSISGDKLILAKGDNVKTYTINRVFVPNTGQNPIKYVAIILGIVAIIGILIFVRKKMDK